MNEGQNDIRARILKVMGEQALFIDTGSGTTDPAFAPRPDQKLFFVNAAAPLAKCNEGRYGLDSLDRVELAMAIEEEFGIEISDDEVNGLETLEQIEAYLAGAGVCG